MYGLAEKLFYTLSAVVLGSAFFVLQPSHNPDVAFFQASVHEEFAKASLQVFGDQPMFTEVPLVISSINTFYEKSADAMIAILTPPPSEDDLAKIAQETYKTISMALEPVQTIKPQVLGAQETEIEIPANFMTEEPVSNIVPEQIFIPEAKVILSDVQAANDTGFSWVNLRDNSTGQVYCVAIYNTEVNRYVGPCKNDYR